MRFLLFITFFGLVSPFAMSQKSDTIYKLNEVLITSARFKYFNTGHFYTIIDSTSKAVGASSHLGDLLNNSSLFQINSYGAGSVSVSARGMGEKRTPVIWNGFNIQSILSTGTDLAQLPSFFFEDVRAQMGGSSALFGSGAAGGVVFLSNRQNQSSGLHGEVISHIGSFGNYYGGAELSASVNKYAVAIKGYYNEALNNFPYKASYSGVRLDTTQSNANGKQYGFMMNNYLRFSSNSSLNFNFWYTNTDKNIAPTLSEASAHLVVDGNQQDEFFASSAEYNTRLGILDLALRTGFFNSKLYYQKPSWAQISDSKANWNINEMEASVNFLKYFKVNGGINFTYEMGKSNSFDVLQERYREALFASVKFYHPAIHLAVSLNSRQEMLAGSTVPLIYSIGSEYSPFQFLTIKGNIAKNYRIPAFNDLYYKDPYSVGNPDLKPERGINYEAGFEMKQQPESFQWGVGMNYFYSKMDNWINWAERPDYIWSVFNIDKARISGIESFLSGGYRSKNFDAVTRLMFTYTHAEDRNSLKDVANVPKQKGTLNLDVRYVKTSMLFQLLTVGSRFSDPANTKKIDPYTTSNIILTQSFGYSNRYLSVDLGVYNLMDKDYMVMNGYPMPKRNFRATLRIQF